MDVAIDYLIARATGGEFHLAHSLAVNAAVNVTTLGVGGIVAKLRHLGKLATLARHADEAAGVVSHADEAAATLRTAERIGKAAEALQGLERFKKIGREGIPAILKAFGDTHRQLGEIPLEFRGRRVTTIGRNWDIEAAKELGGFRVLDDPNWSIERNYEWIMEAIRNGDVFYLASPVTEANLLGDPRHGGVSVFMRELDLLLQAGYRRIGDYLIPPR